MNKILDKKPYIEPLFGHSDCCGIWTPKESNEVLITLNEVYDKFKDLEDDYGRMGNWNKMIDKMIKGLKKSVSENRNCVFG
jgi:hypothetical protein